MKIFKDFSKSYEIFSIYNIYIYILFMNNIMIIIRAGFIRYWVVSALEVIRCNWCLVMSSKQVQGQIIFANSKHPTGFDKVVSSAMFSSYFFQVIFPLMMEFIVPRNLVSRKHYHFYSNYYYYSKKDWQCKAGRGRLTPYHSEDPSPTLLTYRGKEEKGKIVLLY